MKKILLSLFLLFALLSISSCKGANRRAYETIEYGRYPITKVSNEKIIEKLDTYLDSDKNKDGYFELDGKEYLKSWANPYHTNYTFSDKTYIRKDQYYYFEVKNIPWRVIKTDDNYKYLLSDYIIETQDFITRDATDIDYVSSTARKFINGDFYNIAFSKEENKPLQTEIVVEKNNGVKQTLNENIWLPSVYDIDNKDNGFYTDDDKYAFVTDYALSKGIIIFNESPNSYFYNAAAYMTSTNSSTKLNSMFYIDIYGKTSITYEREEFINTGIRPCIRIAIN